MLQNDTRCLLIFPHPFILFFLNVTQKKGNREEERVCVCACVVISSEADKKMKELNERQMRASLENSRAPLFSHLQCCGVVRPTREHLGQNSLSLPLLLSFIVSLEFGLFAVEWRAGPSSSLRTGTLLSSQTASGSGNTHTETFKSHCVKAVFCTAGTFSVLLGDHVPGRSTSGFRPRSSCRRRYRTLRSSLARRTE